MFLVLISLKLSYRLWQ